MESEQTAWRMAVSSGSARAPSSPLAAWAVSRASAWRPACHWAYARWVPARARANGPTSRASRAARVALLRRRPTSCPSEAARTSADSSSTESVPNGSGVPSGGRSG